jgi:rubrerythrin
MADKFVFNPQVDPMKVLTPGADPKKILDVAIEREKDSIIFFEGIKAMVPEKFGSKRIDEIIGQEMGHVIILTRHRDKLQPIPALRGGSERTKRPAGANHNEGSL